MELQVVNKRMRCIHCGEHLINPTPEECMKHYQKCRKERKKETEIKNG